VAQALVPVGSRLILLDPLEEASRSAEMSLGAAD
jgi:hypothetical protein